jgi:hypothetical protein
MDSFIGTIQIQSRIEGVVNFQNEQLITLLHLQNCEDGTEMSYLICKGPSPALEE